MDLREIPFDGGKRAIHMYCIREKAWEGRENFEEATVTSVVPLQAPYRIVSSAISWFSLPS